MREQKMWAKLVTIHNRTTKKYTREEIRPTTAGDTKKVDQHERTERELEDK